MPPTDPSSQEALAELERRGRALLPFRLMLHAPGLADVVEPVGRRLRYGSAIPDATRELLTLLAAYRWSCTYELAEHRQPARDAGVRNEVVDHLVDGGTEPDWTPEEAQMRRLVAALGGDGHIGPALYEQLTNDLPIPQLVEAVTLVGYYSMLAWVIDLTEAQPSRAWSRPSGGVTGAWDSVPDGDSTRRL